MRLLQSIWGEWKPQGNNCQLYLFMWPFPPGLFWEQYRKPLQFPDLIWEVWWIVNHPSSSRLTQFLWLANFNLCCFHKTKKYWHLVDVLTTIWWYVYLSVMSWFKKTCPNARHRFRAIISLGLRRADVGKSWWEEVGEGSRLPALHEGALKLPAGHLCVSSVGRTSTKKTREVDWVRSENYRTKWFEMVGFSKPWSWLPNGRKNVIQNVAKDVFHFAVMKMCGSKI